MVLVALGPAHSTQTVADGSSSGQLHLSGEVSQNASMERALLLYWIKARRRFRYLLKTYSRSRASCQDIRFLTGRLLADETDPYFSWQFDETFPYPKDCERTGDGTNCVPQGKGTIKPGL